MHTSTSVTSLLDFLLFHLVTMTGEMMTLHRWSFPRDHLKLIILLILLSHFTNFNYEIKAKQQRTTVWTDSVLFVCVSLYLITYTAV